MKKPKQFPNKSGLGKYAYYSGAGFQMLAIIGLFTYAGHRIDESRQSGTPTFTALLALAGVCIAIYTVIRMVTSRKRP